MTVPLTAFAASAYYRHDVGRVSVRVEPANGRALRVTPGTFQITTRNKILVPHVLAIPVGSTVVFPNDDPISHNLFSLSSNNSGSNPIA